MFATRREWSRRQATMNLVFAFDDREVNNDFEKKCEILFLENFRICVAVRGYLFIRTVDACTSDTFSCFSLVSSRQIFSLRFKAGNLKHVLATKACSSLCRIATEQHFINTNHAGHGGKSHCSFKQRA